MTASSLRGPAEHSPRLSAAALVRRLPVDLTPAARPVPAAGSTAATSAAAQPSYRRLAAAVVRAATDGRIACGSALPSERELAAALGFSRTTVAAGYAVLREQGWLHSRQGAPSRLVIPGVPAGSAAAFDMRTPGHRQGEPSTPATAAVTSIDLGIASLPAPAEFVGRAVVAATADLTGLLETDGYHPHGLPALREQVALQYAQQGLATSPDQILITSGAQHGWFLAMSELTEPGDRILVESPTYPTALDAIRSQHRVPVTLPLLAGEPRPWDLELLAAVLRSSAPRLAYLIPDHQNPTGAVMSAQDRADVVALLGRAGCSLVVDESFRSLSNDLPVSMASGADPERVLAIGSMSKPFWGGLRVGWVRAAPGVIDRLAAARALIDMAGPVLDQLVAVHLLRDPDAAVAQQNARLAATREAALAAIAELLPNWHVQGPAAGVTLWVRLPGPYASELAKMAAAQGVRIVAGPRFGPDGTMEHHLRLPVTAPPEILVEAIRRLATVDAAAAVSRRSGAVPGRIG